MRSLFGQFCLQITVFDVGHDSFEIATTGLDFVFLLVDAGLKTLELGIKLALHLFIQIATILNPLEKLGFVPHIFAKVPQG